MKQSMIRSLMSILCLLAVMSAPAYAQAPQTINYQGVLLDSVGVGIDGDVAMTFAIYDQAVGGAALWSETLTVHVDLGKYSVILGKTTPIDLPGAKPYWLGITVETDAEMTPRVEMTSVMYSLFPEGVQGPPGPAGPPGPPAPAVPQGPQAPPVTGPVDDFYADDTNTFAGWDAGASNTTGIGNTFIGAYAGQANTTGWGNTFIGDVAGVSNTIGRYNTFIGLEAGFKSEGSRNVFLGYEAGYNETGSNKLYIDNSDTPTPLIYGDFSADFVRVHGNFIVTGNAFKPGGGAWIVYSDRNLKEVRGSFTRSLDAIGQLQPVRYQYKANNALNLPSDEEYVGLVAQEVQAVIPEAVEENADGYLVVNNDPIMWTMLNAIKDLKAENEALKKQLQTENEALREEINLLKQRLGQ